MSTAKFKQKYLACLIIGLLLIASALGASDFISLSEGERKRIDQGEIVVREVDTAEKRGKIFEAIGLINAHKDTVLKVLTAYEMFPEFMPNVSSVQILEQRGNEWVINYTLKLPLGIIKKYRFKIFVIEPENPSSMIHWQLQEWPELKTDETIVVQPAIGALRGKPQTVRW